MSAAAPGSGAPLVRNHAVRGHVARRRKLREPAVVERQKTTAFVCGQRVSERGRQAVADLVKIKKPLAVPLTRKHEMLPMDNPAELETLLGHGDHGLFVFANHSKKRPDNFVFGRLFDGHVLDMVELGLTHFEPILKVQARSKVGAALEGVAPPMMVFRGEGFANSPEGSELATLKSVLLDVFRGVQVDEMDLEALDLAIVFTSLPAKTPDGKPVITMRTYRTDFAAGGPGAAGPKVTLVEHGPHADFEMRRSHIAAPNLAKLARKQAKLRPVTSKRKNVEHDKFRGKVGKLHVKRQSLDGLVQQSRFRKALKRKGGPAKEGGGASPAASGKEAGGAGKKARRG